VISLLRQLQDLMPTINWEVEAHRENRGDQFRVSAWSQGAFQVNPSAYAYGTPSLRVVQEMAQDALRQQSITEQEFDFVRQHAGNRSTPVYARWVIRSSFLFWQMRHLITERMGDFYDIPFVFADAEPEGRFDCCYVPQGVSCYEVEVYSAEGGQQAVTTPLLANGGDVGQIAAMVFAAEYFTAQRVPLEEPSLWIRRTGHGRQSLYLSDDLRVIFANWERWLP